MNFKTLRRLAFPVGFTVLTLIVIYLAGGFFLLPFYSVIGRVKNYDGSSTLVLPRHKYLATIKSTTTMQEQQNSNFVVQVSLFSNRSYSITEDDVCPDHFVGGVDDAPPSPLSPLPCGQTERQTLQFIAFQSPDLWGPEDVAKNNYLVERSIELHELELDLRTHSLSSPKTDAHTSHETHPPLTVDFQLHIMRSCVIGVDDLNGEICRCRKEVDVATECDNFFRSVVLGSWAQHDKQTIIYKNETIDCFAPPHQATPTCAIGVYIGHKDECFGHGHADLFDPTQKSTPECRFTVRYGLYLLPPSWLTIGSVWTWGVIGFVSSFALWMYATLYHGRRLHLNYLQNYYVHAQPFAVRGGHLYHVKVFVTGEQFTKRAGVLEMCVRGHVVYSLPLNVVFNEEDEEGLKLQTVLFRGSFSPDHDLEGVEFCARWTDQFHMADFLQPAVQVVFRQEMPPFVKTRLNLFFMPLFLMTKQLTKQARDKFIAFDSWLFLCTYFAAVHTGIVVVLVYTFVAYTQNKPEFWGSSPNERPPMPLPAYLIFCLGAIIPVVLTFLRFCRPKTKSSGLEGSGIRLKERNAFALATGSSSVVSRDHHNKSHHDLTVEYRALAPNLKTSQNDSGSISQAQYAVPDWESSTPQNATPHLTTKLSLSDNDNDTNSTNTNNKNNKNNKNSSSSNNSDNSNKIVDEEDDHDPTAMRELAASLVAKVDAQQTDHHKQLLRRQRQRAAQAQHDTTDQVPHPLQPRSNSQLRKD